MCLVQDWRRVHYIHKMMWIEINTWLCRNGTGVNAFVYEVLSCLKKIGSKIKGEKYKLCLGTMLTSFICTLINYSVHLGLFFVFIKQKQKNARWLLFICMQHTFVPYKNCVSFCRCCYLQVMYKQYFMLQYDRTPTTC